jgi:CBS domain containing-hemolysin-like protein
MDYTLLSGILLSLVLAIFFSGIEVAFLSANKLQIELQRKQGSVAGHILSFFVERPTWFIGTTLIGNIASLICFGIFTTRALIPVIETIAPTVAGTIVLPLIVLTFVLTIVVLYTVEFLSKSFFIINSNTMMAVLAWPFVLISIALFPLVYSVISLAKFISLYILKLEYSMDKPVFGLTDVDQYLKSIHWIKPAEQNIELDKKIFTNALEFKSVRVRDCMIPRTEIIAVSQDSGIKKLHEAFIESGHSKIIIYKDSIDDVIGYCHSSALFKKPLGIEDILTPIITAPETQLAKDLMVRFINERKSLAIVVDEFGGTSGIVSMEDVIEEIFGEIEDEHDQDDEVEQKLGENTYLLSARLEIHYLNEKYGWNLPEGDYDTLSGLILSYTEDLPKQGQTIQIPPFTFIIQSTAENRINTVKIIDESKEFYY